MQIAAIQFQPRFLEKEHNLLMIEKHISSLTCDLVVLPELCTSGYFFENHDQVSAMAEEADGTSIRRIFSMAKRKQLAIVMGFLERTDNAFFNSAVFITPDGVKGLYRKTHLFGEEKIWFTPGDTGFQVFDYRDMLIGIMICYDWRFPEAARSLVLSGAEIICHPSNLVSPEWLWRATMQTRSIENKVITITANRTGAEYKGDKSLTFTGCSQIVNYNGDVLAESDATSEGIISAAIEIAQVRKKSFSEWNDIIADRRPELYVL